MKVRYSGPHEAVEIAETGQVVTRDGSVEVSDDLGRRLCEQSVWSEVKAARKKAPAATTKQGDE